MSTKLTTLRVACIAAFVLAAGAAFFFRFGATNTDPRAAPRHASAVEPARARPLPTKPLPPRKADDRGPAQATNHSQGQDDSERWKTAPIEDIKQALYEREIDSVDQLHLLDEFVQIGDADTRDFWNTDWAGVDDWKRNSDGFSLEKLDDGTLVFVPGEETRRAYTFFESMNVYDYDEQTQEFVHEIDYYGKPIVNIVKFLREDVMVMMVVSGDKVDMNIYELDQDRRD